MERRWVSFPPRLGGLGIANPVEAAAEMHEQATKALTHLVGKVLTGPFHRDWFYDKQRVAERDRKASRDRRIALKARLASLQNEMTDRQKKLSNLLTLKSAGYWLTTTALKEHGFVLNRQAFRVIMCVRYGRRPEGLQPTCACGKKNSVDHAVSCLVGGYRSRVHNQIRDTTARICKEAGYTWVEIEPGLLPLRQEAGVEAKAGTGDNAGPDLMVNGFFEFGKSAYYQEEYLLVKRIQSHRPKTRIPRQNQQ